MKKAMRQYHPGPVVCPDCGDPILLTQAAVFVNGAYQHNYNCLAPKGRPSPETRERLRKAAGL